MRECALRIRRWVFGASRPATGVFDALRLQGSLRTRCQKPSFAPSSGTLVDVSKSNGRQEQMFHVKHSLAAGEIQAADALRAFARPVPTSRPFLVRLIPAPRPPHSPLASVPVYPMPASCSSPKPADNCAGPSKHVRPMPVPCPPRARPLRSPRARSASLRPSGSQTSLTLLSLQCKYNELF